MKFLEHIQILERLDQLIRLKATGTPCDLAERLNVSERTVYNLLEILRETGCRIAYSKERCSYFYESKITIQFLKVMIENTDQITGGENKINFFSSLQNFCSAPTDVCNRLTNNNEHNNARVLFFENLSIQGIYSPC